MKLSQDQRSDVYSPLEVAASLRSRPGYNFSTNSLLSTPDAVKEKATTPNVRIVNKKRKIKESKVELPTTDCAFNVVPKDIRHQLSLDNLDKISRSPLKEDFFKLLADTSHVFLKQKKPQPEKVDEWRIPAYSKHLATKVPLGHQQKVIYDVLKRKRYPTVPKKLRPLKT